MNAITQCNDMSKLVYLASPYSHPDAAVREARFDAACRATAISLRVGHFVYSPIAHTHPLAVKYELPSDWKFWAAFDEAMISRCDRLWVLEIDGWRESVGVTAEIEIARRIGIRVDWLRPDGGSYSICSEPLGDTR